MKSKGLIITVIVILIIAGIGVGVYFLGQSVGTDLKQEQLLIEEISTLSALNPEEDDYNTPIKTEGVYAEIETTIKEYLASYANSTQKASKLMTQMQESNLLTNENYKQDGPEFTQSLETIKSLRTQFNEEMDNLINLSTVETINKKGEEKNWDNRFFELYKTCMLDSEIEADLEQSKEQLEEAKTAVNDTLDQQEKILTFLKDNKDDWQVSDSGKLEFNTQEILDQYAALVTVIEE